jgi:N-acetyl-anhydromuramyl-L-alanine amidase AmpD
MYQSTSSYRNILTLISCLFLFAGCASSPKQCPRDRVSIAQDLPCVEVEPRKQPIRYLILHHTAASLPSSIQILQGKSETNKVGIHYLVCNKPQPQVYRFAPEHLATSHAGKSAWRQDQSLNQSSVGIEIVNLDGNLNPYPPSQIAQIIALCQEIIIRYKIDPTHVLAHSDISIGRKKDPGSLFPWKELAEAGIGAWPDEADIQKFQTLYAKKLPDKKEIVGQLIDYGYRPYDSSEMSLKLTIEAFQRHFRGKKVDGEMDVETAAMISALHAKYCQPLPSTAKN